MKEHDAIVLTRALPEYGLVSGDMGAIVHAYPGGRAYEVEFVAGGGATIAVVTLEARDLRSLGASDILHVRTKSA